MALTKLLGSNFQLEFPTNTYQYSDINQQISLNYLFEIKSGKSAW